MPPAMKPMTAARHDMPDRPFVMLRVKRPAKRLDRISERGKDGQREIGDVLYDVELRQRGVAAHSDQHVVHDQESGELPDIAEGGRHAGLQYCQDALEIRFDETEPQDRPFPRKMEKENADADGFSENGRDDRAAHVPVKNKDEQRACGDIRQIPGHIALASFSLSSQRTQ